MFTKLVVMDDRNFEIVNKSNSIMIGFSRFVNKSIKIRLRSD